MSAHRLEPVGLKCGHRVAPLAVEPDRLRFSWQVQGEAPSGRVTAYQVVVAGPEAGTGRQAPSVWDSGQVGGADITDVPYAGAPLEPGCRYSWSVRVWDEAGAPSPFSPPSPFETALAPGSWGASWIGLGPDRGPHNPPEGERAADPVTTSMHAAPYLRRSFMLDKDVGAARLYVTALGLYQVSINGQRVGDAVLAPGWTDYDQRMLYQAYDVTDWLTRGENVLAVVLADGWACGYFGFNPKRPGAHYADEPKLLLRLSTTFTDGTRAAVVSDHDWKSTTGGIVYADLLMGERQDASREPVGWERPGYDDGGWRAVSCGRRDGVLLVADPGPPVRVTEELACQSVVRGPGGELIVDFGQNLAGWVRLHLDGAQGANVQVRHGEVLNPDGSLYVENLRTARQADSYSTSMGSKDYEPRFTFHGFRYCEVTGVSGNLTPEAVTACVVHSDIPKTGHFECSSAGVKNLYANIDWGQRGNFISVPTDCPQRDERLGWLGDAQIFARTAAYNRDVAAFFSKWADDVADAQLASGAFPDFAPDLGYEWGGAPAWADAGVIVPWTVYKMYGDRGILERNFASMARWMEFLDATNPDRLRRRELGNNYGDWLAPKGDFTSRELIGSAYWAYDAALMAETAHVLGREEQASRYSTLCAEIKEAFAEAYLGPDGEVESGTQTAYVLALHMGLVPDASVARTAQHLVEAVAREEWHLSTGFVGVAYLLPVLSAHGYTDVAYRLLEQRTFPSWQYTIERGATTIWERWDGSTEEHGFQSPSMNSFNHYSLGAVGEWLYRFVLGIEQVPGAAGFARILARPHPGGSLTHARGSFASVRGTISSAWSLEGDRFTLEVELPPNTTASVRVPSGDPGSVVDGAGAPPVAVAGYPGVRGGEEAVYEVGPGRHRFTAKRLQA